MAARAPAMARVVHFCRCLFSHVDVHQLCAGKCPAHSDVHQLCAGKCRAHSFLARAMPSFVVPSPISKEYAGGWSPADMRRCGARATLSLRIFMP